MTSDELHSLEHDATKLQAFLQNFERARNIISAAASLDRDFRAKAQAEAALIVSTARDTANQNAAAIISKAEGAATDIRDRAKADAVLIRSNETAATEAELKRVTQQLEGKKRALAAINVDIDAAKAQLNVLKRNVETLREQIHTGVPQ